jgi:hypothetical protein
MKKYSKKRISIKYRRKNYHNLVIEAIHFQKDSEFDDILNFMRDSQYFRVIFELGIPTCIVVETTTGARRCYIGDWIIKDRPRNHCFTLPDIIFQSTYELIE